MEEKFGHLEKKKEWKTIDINRDEIFKIIHFSSQSIY